MTEEERNQIVQEKLNQGYSLGDVQRLLADEYDEVVTYMDLKLIATELDIDWEQQEPAQPETPPEDAEAAVAAAGEEHGPEAAPGTTQVTMSKVVRPGAAMSGNVVFKSGAKAEWYVDQFGRLGLNPESDSDKPTEEDLREFQEELQRQLSGSGG